MSEDAGPNYEWTCPRAGCKRVINAFSERGMKLLAEEHINQHMREDREMATVTKVVPAPTTKLDALSVLKNKNYDILELTPVDIGFLKTRGIKTDGIEIDLVSEYKNSKSELNQKRWGEILDAAMGRDSWTI